MMNFSKYIDIPYKNLGRDFEGVDCWGLICLIFKHEKNIILPDFTELKYEKGWYKKGHNHILDNKGTIDGTFWDIVNRPYKVYDGFIFYLSSEKIANHTGMYIGNNKFIHVYEEKTSCINRLDDLWKSKMYAAFRYKG